MSYVKEKGILQKVIETRSWRSFGVNFFKDTMAGQKMFLYNEELPRVINLSFNESTCMFSCKMCPYNENAVRDMYKKGSFMSFETLKNIVASIPNDSHYSFDISAIGETLQFKELPEFVAYMKKERPKVNTIVSTNGLLLNEKLSRKLVDSGLDNLQISFFAGNSEDHKYITETETFDRVADNIRRFRKIRDESGRARPFIQTFMMESEETRHRSEEFVKYWSQYVDQAFVRPLYNVGRKIEGMTPTFDNPTRGKKRHPCITPWYSTAIRSNGDVMPCYMFHWHRETKDEVVGNINEQSLKEIWQSEKFRLFRDAHRRLELEDYPICQECDLWDAYTNVWDRVETNGYRFGGVSFLDFFRKVEGYRGG